MKKSFFGLIVFAIFMPFLAYGQAVNWDKSITQQLAAAMKADAMENYGEAFPIFKKLADLGEPMSQYYVGNYYLQGLGIDRNDQQAFEWFSKAADVNYPQALLATGKMLIAGIGIQKNLAAGITNLMAAGYYGNEEGLALSCIAYNLYLKDAYSGYYWCLLSSRHLSHQPKLDSKVADMMRDLEVKLKAGQIQSITANANDWQPKAWEYPTNFLSGFEEEEKENR